MDLERNTMQIVYRWIVLLIGACVATIACVVGASAQGRQGFIYGKVYTDKNIYTGPIRWGKEEVLWTDEFNAAKTSSRYEKMVPEQKEESDSWLNFDWKLSSIWEDKSTTHQFTCQFGNITEVIPQERSNVLLKFKNGRGVVVNGEGYNDIGATIHVWDSELGELNINWDHLKRIEFMPFPVTEKAALGAPIFGTVESVRHEKFTGFIIWDKDERLSTDKLDGDANDSDVSIAFADIMSIEKSGRGCDVVLKSGRSFHLTNSNDVNSENRGVQVYTQEVGIVTLSWDAFRQITLTPAPNGIAAYEDFPVPHVLRGTVSLLDDNDATGQIVYDIDEVFDFEFLEGQENDIEYQIPFRNVKKITPRNFDYAAIELRSGRSLLLGGGRDVSSKNAGLLILGKDKECNAVCAVEENKRNNVSIAGTAWR